jgi:hydrogenase expression/formation protein HypE
MTSEPFLPLGKLPPELLARLLATSPVNDPRILLGPGIGFDCAVLDMGSSLLVLKSDPITFASDEIGWYAVQINANDIATTGAAPRWFLITALLPENATTAKLVEQISSQVNSACKELGISVIGGHTEITHGLDRPIVMGTLIGEVARDRLVTPRGAQPGDHVLLTKGIPIEATSILAREFHDRLLIHLSENELQQAADFLHHPGISVVQDARIAVCSGKVTAMHDPTEGGLAAALWELAIASSKTISFDPGAVYVPPLSKRICEVFDLNPLATIASGALLLTAPPSDAAIIVHNLHEEGILCMEIGLVEEGGPIVHQKDEAAPFLHPSRDDITKAYE